MLELPAIPSFKDGEELDADRLYGLVELAHQCQQLSLQAAGNHGFFAPPGNDPRQPCNRLELEGDQLLLERLHVVTRNGSVLVDEERRALSLPAGEAVLHLDLRLLRPAEGGKAGYAVAPRWSSAAAPPSIMDTVELARLERGAEDPRLVLLPPAHSLRSVARLQTAADELAARLAAYRRLLDVHAEFNTTARGALRDSAAALAVELEALTLANLPAALRRFLRTLRGFLLRLHEGEDRGFEDREREHGLLRQPGCPGELQKDVWDHLPATFSTAEEAVRSVHRVAELLADDAYARQVLLGGRALIPEPGYPRPYGGGLDLYRFRIEGVEKYFEVELGASTGRVYLASGADGDPEIFKVAERVAETKCRVCVTEEVEHLTLVIPHGALRRLTPRGVPSD